MCQNYVMPLFTFIERTEPTTLPEDSEVMIGRGLISLAMLLEASLQYSGDSITPCSIATSLAVTIELLLFKSATSAILM